MAVLEYKSFKEKEAYDGTQVVLNYGDYDLSIVRHSGSYGGTKGYYEIAVFKGPVQIEMPGITEEHDTVKGWLTEADVGAIIKKMYFLTGVSPKQI